MTAEHKLIIRMSNCLRCGNAYEPGDKFCQDCGASVAVVPGAAEVPAPALRPSLLAAWRERLPDWHIDVRIDRVPAEVILIAAAFAYMGSAALWSNYAQLHKAFQQFKMPSINFTAVKLPAINGGAAPDAVAKQKSVDQAVARQTAPVSNGAPQAHESAAVPVSSEQNARPESGRRNALPLQSISQEHSRPRRNTTDEPLTAAGADEQKTPPASEAVKEDLAEYNRLLAAYFENAGDSSQARPEPPSYSEWIAAGKPQF